MKQLNTFLLMSAIAVAGTANATEITALSGFTTFANMNNTIHINPTQKYVQGWNAPTCTGSFSQCGQNQQFDAEKLAYKREGNTLYIALKTGFDINDGHQKDQYGRDVFAGDLALSFKTKAGTKPLSSYDYAIDFGLETRDWKASPKGVNANSSEYMSRQKWAESAVEMDGNGDAKDTAGVYKNVTWNTDTGYQTTAFAASAGTKLSGLVMNNVYYENGSFIRVVGFDLAAFGYTADQAVQFTAAWTMSCGNDNVWGDATAEGTSEVPVPAAAWLFGSALLGLAGVKRKA